MLGQKRLMHCGHSRGCWDKCRWHLDVLMFFGRVGRARLRQSLAQIPPCIAAQKGGSVAPGWHPPGTARGHGPLVSPGVVAPLQGRAGGGSGRDGCANPAAPARPRAAISGGQIGGQTNRRTNSRTNSRTNRMPRSQPNPPSLAPLPGKQVQPRKSLPEPFPCWLPHSKPSS